MAKTDKLVELINRLKTEAGDEPLVINFADGNHISAKTHETVANPVILEALKNANIKDLVLEMSPTDGLQEFYQQLKLVVAANKDYSSSDYLKSGNLDPKRLSKSYLHFLDLLISSAKQNMGLSFPDNASIKGSAGEISKYTRDIHKFLQGSTPLITKSNDECIEPVLNKLAEKVPQSHLRYWDEEITLKRTGDNASSDKPVIETVNKKIARGKNVAVVYGADHFTGENDLNDGQQAKHKPVILIATDNDLAISSNDYEQAKQLPQYRYNPETGEVSKFNIEQVRKAVSSGQNNPEKLTTEQCQALVPEDLRFKNYSPEEIHLVDVTIPDFVKSMRKPNLQLPNP